MSKTQISAEVIAHSKNSFGDELISYKLIFPRFILAEFNKHRMFSSNTSSSRAIPISRMIKAVKEDPVVPIAWQKGHRGMQGNEYHTEEDSKVLDRIWLTSLSDSLQIVEKLDENNVTKQICNRLLEPFMWVTMVATMEKSALENMFELRCPMYSYNHNRGKTTYYKSKKEWMCNVTTSSLEDMSSKMKRDPQAFLKINKGEAEIHFMDLAEKMYDAYNESEAKLLSPGEWHIPWNDVLEEKFDLDSESPYCHKGIGVVSSEVSDHLRWVNDIKVKIATVMAARTSYTIINQSDMSISRMLEIYDDLIKAKPLHASPMEHCAMCMSNDEYYSNIRGFAFVVADTENVGWCRNFKGFRQLRDFIENEN